MQMQWSDITVFQFQQLFALWDDPETKDRKTEADVMAEAVAICFGLSLNQVDSMPFEEFKEKAAALDFLTTQPPAKTVKHFTANGRRYRFVFDVRQIHAGRNIEVKHFSKAAFPVSLHRQAASMVIPQRRTWYGRWVDDTYDAAKHEEYASDILQAPITAIHGSAVFFCKLFINLITSTADYLTSTIPMRMREEAKYILLNSWKSLDGTFRPS